MNSSVFLATTLSLLFFLCDAATAEERVKTTILNQPNGEICLIHEVELKASRKKVWDAYTTTEGWKSWVSPVARVDLKTGGVILSNYRKDGKLDDVDSITIHIINYVPERLLTLQAELGTNFPKVLKEREKMMFNVITFEAIDDNTTKLISYGAGYKDSPELKKMLQFFTKANEQSYQSLIQYVENGEAKPFTKK